MDANIQISYLMPTQVKKLRIQGLKVTIISAMTPSLFPLEM
jgi:hypothetical protein